MKYLIVFVLSALTPQAVFATPLAAKQIEAELGAALGFKVYRYEAELADDEVLIVRHISESNGNVTEMESAQTGGHVKMNYQIVLVDSGAFHRSLRNTYMLRVPGSDGYIEGMRLSRWKWDPEGAVEFEFSNAGGNDKMRTLKWIGSVEKYSEVIKRWPELPKPRRGIMSGSSRFIKR